MKSTNLIPRRMREQLCDVGVGGWDCNCCTPNIATSKLNKHIRTKLKQELYKELKENDIGE